jgi:hypothetical protein
VDLEAGASAHFLSVRPSPPIQAENPDVGPTLAISGHVAVLPLLRAGAYVSHDFSPLSGADLRELTSAGLSLRLFSPWPQGDIRVWLAAGVGYAAAYAPSYTAPMALGNQASVTTTVSGTSGGFVELPVGLGSSLRLGRGFELVGEAGARIGVGFTGSMYNQGPTVSAGGLTPRPLPPAGDDVLTIFVVLGAALQL